MVGAPAKLPMQMLWCHRVRGLGLWGSSNKTFEKNVPVVTVMVFAFDAQLASNF